MVSCAHEDLIYLTKHHPDFLGYDMRMDATAPNAIAHDVLVQLQKRNKLSSGFKEIVEDYQRILRQCKEQEVGKF